MTLKEWHAKYQQLNKSAGRLDINGQELKKGDWVRSTPAYDLYETYEGRIDRVPKRNLIEVDGYRSASHMWEKIDQPGPAQLIRRKNILLRLRRSARDLKVTTFVDLDRMLDQHLRVLLSRQDFKILEKTPLGDNELSLLLR